MYIYIYELIVHFTQIELERKLELVSELFFDLITFYCVLFYSSIFLFIYWFKIQLLI